MIILTISLLNSYFTYAEINLDLTDMTLPQALTAIGESVSEDSPFYKFEFKLPRAYKNKGEKIPFKYKIDDEKPIPSIFRDLAELHGLIRNFGKNDDGIIRFMHPYGNERISLLEAIGASERNMKQNEIGKGFQLAEAEIKYEKSETYSGYWWHLKYSKIKGTDGGTNTIHVFVYSNSFVEYDFDSQGISPALENTEETVKKSRERFSPY